MQSNPLKPVSLNRFFETPIEFLKGVGPAKATLLQKELQMFNFGDLIQWYPFRYEDRTKFYSIGDLHQLLAEGKDLPYLQMKGQIKNLSYAGGGRRRRLIASFSDGTGQIELVWFKGVQWFSSRIKPEVDYIIYGKPTLYGRKMNIAHPEIEVAAEVAQKDGYLQPVYSTTEKLKTKYLDSKALAKLVNVLLDLAQGHIDETLSDSIIDRYKLISKLLAIRNIHFPDDSSLLQKARFRLKFEELFYIQLRLLKEKMIRIDRFRGQEFKDVSLLNEFYNDHLPFELTAAQKRVIKECYFDLKSGKQMNRLLQGDVGSGKTMVAFICMLLVLTNQAQAALMAPTEILADQHYRGLKLYADKLKIRIAKLTGSTKPSERRIIHQMLRDGDLHILVGTHALLEEIVKFRNLGLAVIDEQHRFGVTQRARLWKKKSEYYPHVLVMTATPIPRTLAMTLYGDLDVSTIDELPPGRKPVETIHRYDSNRLKVFGFIKQQIEKGGQIYIVYPLIEESEKLDFKDLMDGYESVCRSFPQVPISIVHGRMKPKDKDFEMQRFVSGDTKIMVATTVIEVGVDVPNASVMVIENAERFGLAQLHQLRGRVGRGDDQSYCILMTKYELSKDSRTRIETLVRSNDGFEIADVDLKLRGPGDLSGTQQSGVLDLRIADLSQDGKILQVARQAALDLLKEDPNLSRPDNINVRKQVEAAEKSKLNWSRIS